MIKSGSIIYYKYYKSFLIVKEVGKGNNCHNKHCYGNHNGACKHACDIVLFCNPGACWSLENILHYIKNTHEMVLICE